MIVEEIWRYDDIGPMKFTLPPINYRLLFYVIKPQSKLAFTFMTGC